MPASGASIPIYQAYTPLPVFNGNHVVIGSWIIGNEGAGIGIRDVIPSTPLVAVFARLIDVTIVSG